MQFNIYDDQPYSFNIEVTTNHDTYLIMSWVFKNVERYQFEYLVETLSDDRKRIWFTFTDHTNARAARNNALLIKLAFVKDND